MKVSIDDVVADIEESLAENSLDVSEDTWIAEGAFIALNATPAELDARCEVHEGVPFVVAGEYQPACGGCEAVRFWLSAKQVDKSYKLYLQCAECRKEAVTPIPFRVVGKERTVTAIAVFLRRRIDRAQFNVVADWPAMLTEMRRLIDASNRQEGIDPDNAAPM